MVNVSVCMAVCNGGEYIIDQLESILDQLGPRDELIITDDQSNDNTTLLINQLKDKRIILICNEQRLGIVKNFEKAITIAKGNYIFLSDQDDIWVTNKIEIQLSDLENSLLSVSDMSVFNSESGDILVESFFNSRGIPKHNFFLSNFYINCFVGSCMAFRKELVPYIIPIPKNCPMHDWWIGLIACLEGDVIFQKKILVKHRHHNFNNSDTSLGKSSYGLLSQFIFRLKMLIMILTFYLKKFKT